MDKSEKVEDAKDRLANRRARLAQKEKQYERQYDLAHSRVNLTRLSDLEVWKFQIEMSEWELEQLKEDI